VPAPRVRLVGAVVIMSRASISSIASRSSSRPSALSVSLALRDIRAKPSLPLSTIGEIPARFSASPPESSSPWYSACPSPIAT
jgi:hypothetical protein